jgi:hypothetical protein
MCRMCAKVGLNLTPIFGDSSTSSELAIKINQCMSFQVITCYFNLQQTFLQIFVLGQKLWHPSFENMPALWENGAQNSSVLHAMQRSQCKTKTSNGAEEHTQNSELKIMVVK